MRLLLTILLVVVVVVSFSCGLVSKSRQKTTDNNDYIFPPNVYPVEKMQPIVNLIRDTHSKPAGFQLTWTKIQLPTIAGYYVRRSKVTIGNDPTVSTDKIVNVSTTQGGTAAKLLPQPAGGAGTSVNAFDIFDPAVGERYFYRISAVDTDGIESKLSVEVVFTVGLHTITALSVNTAAYEAEITITGTNFGSQYDAGTDRVYFTGVKADIDAGFLNENVVGTVNSWSPTQIKAKVPYGATLGKIRIEIEGQQASSATDFEVSDPYITGIANLGGFTKVAMGTEATLMKVTGKNFGAPAGTCTVRLNGNLLNNANVNHISDTEVQVQLPVLDVSSEPTNKYDGLMDVQFGGKKSNQPLIDYNVKPTSALTADVTTGPAPLAVSFDASSAVDPEGTTLKFAWDFSDGSAPIADGANKQVHTFINAGNYKPVVTCTDAEGAKSTAFVDITVNSAGGLIGNWSTFGHDYTHSFRSPFVGPSSNTLKWKYDASGVIHCSPVVSPNGNIHFTRNGKSLFAVDSDGKLKWTFGDNIWWANITVGSDGTVYTGSSNGNTFYSVKPDGTQKWNYLMSSLQSAAPLLKPDGTITIGTEGDGNLYQLKSDGTQNWLKVTGTGTKSSACTDDDGYIYFGSANRNLYCLNPDGSVKWTYPALDEIRQAPSILSNGNVVFGDISGTEYVVKPIDGSKVWSYTVPLNSPISSIAVADNGTTYFGCQDNKVYAIDVSGTKKWDFPTGNSVFATPAIDSNGNIYIGSTDHFLYCLSPAGAELWKYDAGAEIQSSAAIGDDGSIIVGDMTSSLHVIGPGSGLKGLSPPSAINASDGAPTDKVHLTWPSAPNAPDGYNVYRSRKIYGIWEFIGKTTSTNYDDIDADEAKLYEYKVQSFKAGYNCSDFSPKDQGFKTYLFPPENLQATDGTYANDIELTWEKPKKGTDPTAYKVYRSDDGGASYIFLSALGAVNTYKDVTVPKGIKYYYKVVSGHPLFGDSEEGAIDSGYITQPQPPLNFSASDGTDDTKVVIDLDPPATGPVPDKYDIYIAPDVAGAPGVFALLQAGVLPGAFPIDTFPIDGNTYWYQAKSVKTDFSDSDPNTPDSGWAKILSPPTDVNATDGAHLDKTVITWKAPIKGKAPEGYNIYRSIDLTAAYNLIGSVGSVLTYEDITGSKNTVYYYKVASTKPGWVESGKSAENSGYYGEWIKSKVANVVGTYTSMATLEDGSPCIAYFDSNDNDLMFARAITLTPTHSSDWITMKVDNSTDDVGQYPALLLAFDGTPFIAYQNATLKEVWIAQTNIKEPSIAGEWTRHLCDDANEVAGDISAALDVNGNPALAFYGGAGGSQDLIFASADINKPLLQANWSSYTIFDTGNTGQYSSLALMTSGKLAIAYNEDEKNLNFAVSTIVNPAVAADWTTYSIATNSNSKWNTLRLLTDNTPAVSCFDASIGKMRLYTATKSNPSAQTDWIGVTFDDTVTVGTTCDMCCLNSGVPYINYTLVEKVDTRYAKSLVAHPSASNQFTLGIAENSSNSGNYISNTLLFSGLPAVCYRDATNANLYFIRNVSENTETPKLFAPTSLDASDFAFKDRIRVTWVVPQVGARPEKFQLWRSDTGVNGTYNLITTTTEYTNAAEDLTAVAGTVYWYKVASIRTGFTNSDLSMPNDGTVNP